MSTLDSPIPLSDIEAVLAWVDTFKLSRPTKKINRDFSDAVLLAEMLSFHYPKLVEMHNYPPRNSHALKLNNWMTLNRKVLKKLRLNLCCNTMEQLANSAPGVIERVLLMVRDKVRRDEELNKSMKETEQNVSSGGSYYEACGDDENVLLVPMKTRVNGVLETVQQKMVSYEFYQTLKEELKDAKDSAELLKQKVVEHLDNLLKLKDERIEELQRQLERKQSRRKEVEAQQNSISVPFDVIQSPVVADIMPLSRKSSVKAFESNSKISREESKIPIPKSESAIPKTISKPSITEVSPADIINNQVNTVDVVRSDVFQDIKNFEYTAFVDHKESVEEKVNSIEVIIQSEDKSPPDSLEIDEFKDSSENAVITIEASIKKEITDIITPSHNTADLNYII
ncbi:unnamed protein product [Diatraea saccharalis]|uniref:Calponin-homology (CH) domain-containing protein n=1 Tax=Diatraea saccharalis TaxID=40085 RepID=A0A9N9WK07_9NEOP|nr:unnamed protein product [Diatraea saccharalis]